MIAGNITPMMLKRTIKVEDNLEGVLRFFFTYRRNDHLYVILRLGNKFHKVRAQDRVVITG